MNKIKVVDNNLEIEINLEEETKLNFNISLLKNVTLNLSILTSGNSGKVQYKYNLLENFSFAIDTFP